MENKKLGYIICESYPEYSETKVIQEGGFNGKSVAEVILQGADEKNRNGRFYAHEELFPQLESDRIKELMATGTLLAEAGHPMSKDLQRQSTIDQTKSCARFLKLWTEDKNIMAHVTATNNDLGKAFDLDLKEGVKPAWSLRALGSITQTGRGAEVKNLRIITWDSVIYPSHPGAYTQRLVSESTLPIVATQEEIESAIQESTMEGFISPVLEGDLVNFVKEESASLKYLKEWFDFAYSDIKTTNNGTNVILTEASGSTMVIPLERHIHNEIMNYAASRYYED